MSRFSSIVPGRNTSIVTLTANPKPQILYNPVTLMCSSTVILEKVIWRSGYKQGSYYGVDKYCGSGLNDSMQYRLGCTNEKENILLLDNVTKSDVGTQWCCSGYVSGTEIDHDCIDLIAQGIVQKY